MAVYQWAHSVRTAGSSVKGVILEREGHPTKSYSVCRKFIISKANKGEEND